MNTGSATEAWSRGLGAGGLPWLERAARLAPGDLRIGLDLARALLAAGQFGPAAARFEAVVARHDEMTAWVGLASARRGLGDWAGAAAALGQVLARHCVPDVPVLHEMAASVARAAGFDGWLGMDAGLRLVGNGRGGRGLGAPDAAALARVEGVVAWGEAGLEGWASRPAWQSEAPALRLVDAAGKKRRVVFGAVLPSDEEALFLRRYAFKVPAAKLRGLTPPLSLCGADGRHIFGSPVAPLDAAPVPVGAAVETARPAPARRPLVVVVPVYRDLGVTRACLESLFAALPEWGRVVVVDDATPEPALAAYLDKLAGRIGLIRHERNRGFVAAANAGLRAAAGDDALLLNSDTLVPPGALEVLREVAYARGTTASVTPFSNEATILSYPRAAGGNAAPDLAGTVRIQALAKAAHGVRSEVIPTAIGFCMFIRHDALAEVGLLREDVFAQGYGEENDWCMRARAAGFEHRAALGAYVAHVSGLSFGAAGRALARRNLGILNRLYPGYDRLVGDFVRADPLAGARARLDERRLLAGRGKSAAVLMITHSHGGGVARQVAGRAAALRAGGVRPLQMVTAIPAEPLTTPYPWPAAITEDGADDYPNLRFTLPADGARLVRLLRKLRISKIELHHMLGHHPAVLGLAAEMGVEQQVIIHDYSSFCARISLLTRPDEASPWRYCGEPDLAGCEACIKQAGEDGLYEEISAQALWERSNTLLRAAARIVAPAPDVAKRLVRHFPGIKPDIVPWEDDTAEVALRPPRAGMRNIILIGGIGPAKGVEILKDCALDAAARNLPLRFTIAGSSADDHDLLETGRIFITGLADEKDVPEMLRGLDGDLAFLPSIWPETWSFAISEAWRAGLYTIAFDLGVPAARIAATRRGALLPLGLPVPRINDFLCRWRP